MKILLVANYAKEHINKFHLPFIQKCNELGWTVDVACKADAEVPGAHHLFNLPMERNPYRIQTFSAIRQLKEIIQKEQYDVVHCHTYAGKFIGILAASTYRKNGLKVFYTSHGFQYYKGAHWYDWLVFLPIDKWLISKTDLLITINSEDTDVAKKYHFQVPKIEKCPCGIKLDKFQQASTKDRKQVLDEFGILECSTVLIYVAELNSNKNQAMLLRMYEKASKTIDQLYMLLVGPDHSDGKIPKLAEKYNGHVICTGWRSDVPDLIRASDYAVPSSKREGLGINVLEYMYCRVPVIATDNRGHRESVQNGVTGMLVQSNDDTAMARELIKLYRDPEQKKKMVEEAYRRVCQLSDRTAVEHLIDIYKETLNL